MFMFVCVWITESDLNIPKSPFLVGAATFQAGTGLTGFRSVRGTRCLADTVTQ